MSESTKHTTPQNLETSPLSPEQQAVAELSTVAQDFLNTKHAPAVTMVDRATGRSFTVRQASSTPPKYYPQAFKTVTEFTTPEETSYSYVDNTIYGQESCSWYQGDDQVRYVPIGTEPQDSVALDLDAMSRLHESIAHPERIT